MTSAQTAQVADLLSDQTAINIHYYVFKRLFATTHTDSPSDIIKSMFPAISHVSHVFVWASREHVCLAGVGKIAV